MHPVIESALELKKIRFKQQSGVFFLDYIVLGELVVWYIPNLLFFWLF